MKTLLLSTLLLANTLHATESMDFNLTTGYMPDDNRTYGSISINGVLTKTKSLDHKLGLEFLYYSKEIDEFLDVSLESPTLILNYEVSTHLDPHVELYAGVGVGMQFHSLESEIGTLSDDNVGFAQLKAGWRYHFSDFSSVHIGVRRFFFEELTILDVPNLDPTHQWGIEVGFNFSF